MQLYFPICVNNHWFVFVLDIKDHKFVFLNSLYPKGHEFQEIARDYLVPAFQMYWDKFVQVDMDFDQYEYLYPDVLLQPSDVYQFYDCNYNLLRSFCCCVDSHIYTMMFLQYWKSPRTVLRNIFDLSDIPKNNSQIANDLLFLPGNSRMKNRVIEYMF